LDTVDVFGCDDIYEIGGKPIQMPLFAEFAIEDWALMGLRFEMNLLVNAYKKDVKDPERLEIHEDNISYYYQKYFKKNLNAAFFGRKSINDLLRFLGDTLTINNKKILETFLPAEFETFNIFVLLAEDTEIARCCSPLCRLSHLQTNAMAYNGSPVWSPPPQDRFLLTPFCRKQTLQARPRSGGLNGIYTNPFRSPITKQVTNRSKKLSASC